MRVLGLSGMHPDASAALFVDGALVSFVREENTSGVPHDASLPLRAARVALDLAGVASSDLDAVVFHEKPLRRFERTLVSTLARFPRGGRAFAAEVSRWLGDRLWIRGRLSSELGVSAKQVHFAQHMLAHGAAALHAARSGEGAGDTNGDGDGASSWAWLVLDDVGEWAGCAFGRGDLATGAVELLEELHAPATPGLVQGAVAAYLGLDRWHQASLLQDLAAHGEPRFLEDLERALPTSDDGAPALGPGWVLEAGEPGLDPAAWTARVGAPRTPGSPVDPTGDRAAADLAASLEAWLEAVALRLARRALEATSARRLALGGVLATRRRLVERLARELDLDDLAVADLPGDDGTALGAALLAVGEGARATPVWPGGVELRVEPVGLDAEAPTESEPALDPERALADGAAIGWLRGPAPASGVAPLGRLVLRDPRVADAAPELVRQLALGPDWTALRLLVPAEELERWASPAPGLARRARRLGVHVDGGSSDDGSAGGNDVAGARAADGSLWVQAVDAAEEPELHALLLAHGRTAGVAALLAAPLQREDRTLPLGVGEARASATRRGLAGVHVVGPVGAAASAAADVAASSDPNEPVATADVPAEGAGA